MLIMLDFKTVSPIAYSMAECRFSNVHIKFLKYTRANDSTPSIRTFSLVMDPNHYFPSNGFKHCYDRKESSLKNPFVERFTNHVITLQQNSLGETLYLCNRDVLDRLHTITETPSKSVIATSSFVPSQNHRDALSV